MIYSLLNYLQRVLTEFLEMCRNHEDHHSIESVESNVKLLERDWNFIASLCRKIDSSPGIWLLLNQKLSPHLEEISTVASNISSGLAFARGRDYLSRKTSDLVDMIEGYQKDTENLKAVIGKTLDCISFEVGITAGDGYRRDSCVREACLNLHYINEKINYGGPAIPAMEYPSLLNKQVHALYKELEFVDRFIHDFTDHFPSDPVIDAFLRHVSSVAERILIQSYRYWFTNTRVDQTGAFFRRFASVPKRILIQSYRYWFPNTRVDPTRANSKLHGLVDLHDEIDPSTNPKFLELNLECLKAFISRREHHYFQLDDECLRALLTWKGGDYYDYKKETMFLAGVVINSELDYSREDVLIFFAEITAVLREGASLLSQRNQTVFTSLLEFVTNVCLLVTEYYLKIKLTARGYVIIKELLGRFFKDLPHEKTEHGKQSLALIEDVYNEISSNRVVKMSLLRKMVIFKAESFLIELLNSNSSEMAYEKVQFESLLEQLKVFNLILTNHMKEDTPEMEIIFSQIEAFARRITIISYSFLPNRITQEMINKMSLSFSELSDKVHHIKAKLKEISPEFPVPAFPKTYELGFIDLLFRNLGELLKQSPDSIARVKNHIEEVRLHLKSFLMKVSESDMKNPGLKDPGNQIIDLAYKLAYVIDSIEADVQWQHYFWFYNLLGDLRLVDEQVSNIHVKTVDAQVQNVSTVTQVSRNMMSQHSTPATNEEAVDLKDQEEIIIDQLTRGSSHRDIVSIVGMPGIGKTTLARKVYNCQQIKYHFHRLAWCTVSQVYEKRNLLLEIINDIHGLTEEICQKSDADLELKLRQCLLKNRYLVVMDDMWDIGAWNDLQMAFPDDENGSRILLTSRLRSVPLEIKLDSDPHSIRPFSEEESWKLLEKKVFKGEGCPEQLLGVGKEISRHCQGLPLAVVAIAGLLERTEKSPNWWTSFAESLSLSSRIISDPETRCMEILEVSYMHLPEYLKACFLYLGVFLEDKDIPVTKITRFWLAEGFIKTESKSLEDVAEEYLMDLIDRSLVIISKRRSNGKVKECRLHDLLRDLCRSKAKEEKFFQLVTRYDEPYASFPGAGDEFDYENCLDPVTFGSYRLSISLKRNHFIGSRPSGLGTRSLVFAASADSEPRCPYDISFIGDNFKFLWVLDLECINMGISFPAEIGQLIHLRYLAVSGYVQSIPESIANLWKLETFVVKGLRGKVVLPCTIWRMARLRHLHVNNYVLFSLQDKEVGCSFQLDNLVGFSFLALSDGEDTENILKRLPNLRKLKCILLESWNSSKNCNQFSALNLLTHLETLKIVYRGKALNPSEFVLPLNLKEFTLSKFCLPWDHISAIGKLPKLEVLKLVSGTFEGLIWNMREEEFQELKFLKLDTLNIAQWNASCDHLPKLQRLVLQNCKALKKVPLEFADIISLETIEVHWCLQSAEESAREIGEATGEIKILVTRS